jgi:hypothetical protein
MKPHRQGSTGAIEHGDLGSPQIIRLHLAPELDGFSQQDRQLRDTSADI